MKNLLLSTFLFLCYSTFAQQTKTLFDRETIYGKPTRIISIMYSAKPQMGTNKPDTSLIDTTYYGDNGNTLESHNRTGSQRFFRITRYGTLYKDQKVKTLTSFYTDGMRAELKYDATGNPTELDSYQQGETLAYKARYKYNEKPRQLEYDQYDMKDSLRLRKIYQYNDKGFIATENDYSILYNTGDPKDRTEGQLFTTITFTFDAFDIKGNWTKRTTYIAYGNSEPKKTATMERRIEYFPK